jgi:hypothetical protein
MLQLLQDIAVDPMREVGADNPLRQVIVNTHSPIVVREVDESDLLAAVTQETVRDQTRSLNVVFQCLEGTWRSKLAPAPQPLALGTLTAYLSPPAERKQPVHLNGHAAPARKVRRVSERKDVQYLFNPRPDGA